MSAEWNFRPTEVLLAVGTMVVDSSVLITEMPRRLRRLHLPSLPYGYEYTACRRRHNGDMTKDVDRRGKGLDSKTRSHQ